jgi:sigma-B regulation protein RsbU (phosphoserine phosphatase)
VCFSVHADYYWDYPKYITKTTSEAGRKSDVKALVVDDVVMIFYLVEDKRNAQIEFLTTVDFQQFKGPFTAKSGIVLKEGFSPQFDVIYHDEVLFLSWNSLDGFINLSTSRDRGSSWQGEKVIIEDENFCFAPALFVIKNEFFLFYHTESEGRRIDYFFTRSRDRWKTWVQPVQIALGFAGSFFPVLQYQGGNLYVVWQSRPFSDKEIPVFNIYLSVSRDNGVTWSQPIILTDNSIGENTRPYIFFRKNTLTLIWEGDRGGGSGIFYQEYDREGNPVSEEIMVSEYLADAKNPKIVFNGDELIVFFIDGKGGNDLLYYAEEKDGSFTESGPLGRKGRDVIHYLPMVRNNTPYVFWQEKRGILYSGPDGTMSPVKLLPIKNRYIGKSGKVIGWEELQDSSGIEGYCYTFNKKEIDEPDLVNLSPFTWSINLSSKEEGKHYLHIRGKDKAGNYSPTVTIPFVVDLVNPPSPSITPLDLDIEGYFKDNSPVFQWKAKGSDIVGYNYAVTKNKITITNPRVRTKGRKALPEVLEEKIKLAPPWIFSREVYSISPLLNISLYLLLASLLFVTFFVTTDILLKTLSRKQGVPMDQTMTVSGVRKKRFGLRFKFSFLIVALILFLTLGISSVLSIVNIEYQRTALANQMIDKAQLSLENMTNVAREGILNNDELLLLSVIAKTMENTDIKYSVILDNNNRVVAHSDINERGKVLTDEFTQLSAEKDGILIGPEFSTDNLASLYALASPVIFADRRLGTVQLGYSTESIFETINEARRTNIYSTIIVTIVTVVVGIFGAVIMASITIKPIKILAKGANIIGGGRLDYKIHIKARDEIGLLSDEFNRMTDRLLDYQKKMEEKAKLDEQLEIARKIQQDLIPGSGIDNDAISIDGFYKAAVGVGGDYYDFLQIGDGRYGIIMSDVAGKGVPASLMMIMIRTIFKSLIGSGVIDPSKVVTLMNNTLASDISSDRFATLLFGVFDQSKRLFRYTNAGYGPLLVYKKEKGQCFLVQPPSGSVPIGVMPDVDFSEENPIVLSAGDSVFLFTDGIHEARNGGEEEYGMKRLSHIIPTFAEKGSKEMANLIVEDVLQFMGEAEQYDDMTLTVMKIK